jgi:hypothetical protein
MKTIRRIHGWLGVLFAPSIILFALSGLFQLNGCHEGESPNPLIVRMAQIHLHQTPSLPQRRPSRAQPAPTADHDQAPPKKDDGGEPFRPIKAFFVLMSLALMTSSILGVWIAFTSKRDQKMHIGLFAAGVVLPIVLLLV